MTMRLFRNRGYRLYFQLLDSFRHPRCALCFLLSQTEQGMIASFFVSPDKKENSPASQTAMCSDHRRRLKAFATDAAALTLIKTAIGKALGQVSRPFESTSKWSAWCPRHDIVCPLCARLFSEEKILGRALVRFLEDPDFGRAFQSAPLLCSEHLQRCLTRGRKRRGFERLLRDQRAKLDGLVSDLIRFEATGNNPDCWSTALAWWADFVGPPLGAAKGHVAEYEATAAAPSEMDFDGAAFNDPDPEKLAFENEKLNRKVCDLLDRLNELETRAASLEYRVATLSEDNKRLEMGYTGASTKARGLEKLVRDLTAEIKTLKEGSRAKAILYNSTGKE